MGWNGGYAHGGSWTGLARRHASPPPIARVPETALNAGHGKPSPAAGVAPAGV
jgi:hypothetical protein